VHGDSCVGEWSVTGSCVGVWSVCSVCSRYRLVVRTARCDRAGPGSTPGIDTFHPSHCRDGFRPFCRIRPCFVHFGTDQTPIGPSRIHVTHQQ
jgi:hypothetical protein